MVELIKIGNISIYLFGVTIALGMLIGTIFIKMEIKRKKMNDNKMMDLMIYTIIASLLGARIFYVIVFNYEFYFKNPLEIFAIRNGGLSIQGGIIFGTIFAIIYTKLNKMSFLKAADTFAPGIIIGQAIGRIGCDVFGIPMTKVYLWGVKLNSIIYHPVQLYEAYLDFLLFILLWSNRRKIKYDGQQFIRYIIGFLFIRSIVEFFRFNPIIWGPFTVVHLTSITIIVLFIFIRSKLKKKNKINNNIKNKDLIISNKLVYITLSLLIASGTWFYYYIH